MSRLFDGVDDVMSYNLTAGTTLNDDLTLLLVCRIIVTADNTWLSLLEGERSGGTVGCALGRRNNGQIYFVNAGGIVSAGGITDSDNWMILALTRTTGGTGSFHKLPIGGARTTTAMPAIADSLSLASGVMRIGGNDDFANIRVAAAAFWDSTELTTTQLDGILSAKTTQSIADLSPTWLVDDSDAFATNLINPGVMNRTAITGTADDADDPAGWVYGLGGAAAFELNCAPGTYAVTGTAATTARGLFVNAAPGTYAVTGTAATPARGLFVTASPGSFAVTGAAATTAAARLFTASPGSFAITGVAATTARGLFLASDPGVYTVTGSAATPLAARNLSADPGSYTVTGSASSPIAARLFSADPGSYAVTGFVAGLDVATPGVYTLNAEPSVYVVTGAAASPIATRLFTASPGSFTIAGVAATVGRTLSVTAEPAVYTLSGAPVTFVRLANLSADPGVFTLTGTAATLRLEGQAPNLDEILTGWIASANAGGYIAGGGTNGRIRQPVTGSVA